MQTSTTCFSTSLNLSCPLSSRPPETSTGTTTSRTRRQRSASTPTPRSASTRTPSPETRPIWKDQRTPTRRPKIWSTAHHPSLCRVVLSLLATTTRPWMPENQTSLPPRVHHLRPHQPRLTRLKISYSTPSIRNQTSLLLSPSTDSRRFVHRPQVITLAYNSSQLNR